MRRIEAVLFDADGVIQRRPRRWRETLGEVLGFTGDPEHFLAQLFAAEVTALEGQANFTEALSQVLARWKCRTTLDDALHVWTTIEVDRAITETVRALRRSGVACYLASNQEPHRARYMSEVLGYSNLFEKEFYSCRLGLMKPAPAYFRAILKDIELAASHVLFIDDHQVNVDSARGVGLYAATFNVDQGPGALHKILGDFGIPDAQQDH